MSKRNFEHQHDTLVKLFDEFCREHPHILEEIPNHAVLVFQLEGDEVFNTWSQQVAERIAEPNQPLIAITFTLRQAKSKKITLKSLVKLELQPV